MWGNIFPLPFGERVRVRGIESSLRGGRRRRLTKQSPMYKGGQFDRQAALRLILRLAGIGI